MPEIGPYSLATLSFLVFSFVTWQLRIVHHDAPRLSVFAGMILMLAAVRLAVGLDLTTFSGTLILDVILTFGFLVLLARTIEEAIVRAVTTDPNS